MGLVVAKSDDALIGYFAIHRLQNDNNAFSGAMLVIDKEGLPQEFRCTVPLNPSLSQRALYGVALERHAFNTLIGLPLTQALTARPVCYIVRSRDLLELRQLIETPVVHMEEASESFSIGDDSSSLARLTSASGAFQPLTLLGHDDHADDSEFARSAMQSEFDRIDLLEPFARIDAAMDALSKRDKRFK